MTDPIPRRIVFVDDEPNVLMGLKRMLRPMRREWDMAFVSGGREALELMTKEPFDLVVSDMRMPGMTGVDLLTEVMDRYPQTIRFILSGQADRESILRSIGPTHQYLSKPCDPEVLRKAVAGAFALRDILHNPTLVRLVSQIRTIPSLPDLYLKFQELIRADDSSIQAIGALVEQDAGMSAKIMQLVNSAFFGLRVSATNAAQAVSLLGLDVVRALTLLSHVFGTAEDPALPGLTLAGLQRHSLAVGNYARSMCRCERIKTVPPDDAYMAGVLHDVGLLVLMTNRADDYRQVLATAGTAELTITEAERAVFGASHAEVGAYLLGIWGLPHPIVEATAFHHEPALCPKESFSILSSVHVGDVLEHEINGVGFGPFVSRLDDVHIESAGLADRLPEWRDLCEPFAADEDRS
jgi:HD-like signal output (HDOD) protein/CheY-like chemotaxis protein